MDRTRFFAAIDKLGDNLLRLKGNVDFGDERRFVELAGGRLREADPPAGSSSTATAFTAIGFQIGRDELTASFDRAFACGV
jgi:hypothetical protein